MKAKSLILILIAGGCGLVAAIGVSQVIGQGGGGEAPKLQTTRILVASHDLNIGDKLDETKVNFEEWPKDRVPEGSLTSLEDLKDGVPATRFYQGEPILRKKLIDKSSKEVPIPDGYRVAVLKVDSRIAPPNLLPGDRVDVAAVFRKGGDIQFTGTKTILKNVRVFAVNSQMERLVEDGKPIDAKTISVLVTPKQFEMLMLVSEMGKLRLAQRSFNETDDNDANEFDLQELFATPPQNADEDSQGVQLSEVFPATQEDKSDSSDEAYAWEMVYMTPDGMKKIVWRNENELPEEMPLDGGRKEQEGTGPPLAPLHVPAATQPPEHSVLGPQQAGDDGYLDDADRADSTSLDISP